CQISRRTLEPSIRAARRSSSPVCTIAMPFLRRGTTSTSRRLSQTSHLRQMTLTDARTNIFSIDLACKRVHSNTGMYHMGSILLPKAMALQQRPGHLAGARLPDGTRLLTIDEACSVLRIGKWKLN